LDIKLPNDLGLGLKIGSNFAINESLKIGIAVSYTQTLSKFKVEDTVSGANGTIKAFAPLGFTTEISCKF